MIMSNSDVGFSIRNFLYRTLSQEQSQQTKALKTRPRKEPRSTSTTFSPDDPFNVHPGESLLVETDFRDETNTILFGTKSMPRVRHIRHRRSRDSNEIPKRTASDGAVTPSREKASTPTPDFKPDPYHQFAYDTRPQATPPPTPNSEVQVSEVASIDAPAQTKESSVSSKDLILPSFADHLDRAIGTFNPDNSSAENPAAPPNGILNLPYSMNGSAEVLDSSHPSYDTDWDERLFDPVPGAGVYVGEFIDPSATPKDWNVVYISLDWVTGEAVAKALPYNRRGMKVGFLNPEAHPPGGEVRRADIELRRGFAERWASNMDEEALLEIKGFCKERLIRKTEADYKRELRFEEEVGKFWREKKGEKGLKKSSGERM